MYFAFPVLSQKNEFIKVNGKYKRLTFEHLSIENGLSQIAVNAILQDSKGFLWFGTEDGLNRYDGYKFDIFKPITGNNSSINDNFIWDIFEDSQNNLWIGTNSGGLNKYNYGTNSFQHFLNNPKNKNSLNNNNVRVIYESKKNLLWIGYNNGALNKFNKQENSFESVNLIINGKKNSNSIRAICEDNNENLWIGTDGNGLIKLNNDGKIIRVFKNSKLNNNSLSGNFIWSLLVDGNVLWIGTYNQGLNKLNIKTGKISHYKKNKGKASIINNNITDLMLDQNKHLWITTEDGLSILDTRKNIFINYQNDIADLSSISNNFVRTVIQDNSGLIWFGTVGGGVNKVNLDRKFKHFFHNPSDVNSLSHNVIRSIYEDTNNNIWIGTLGKGLDKFNKYKNTFQHFYSNSKSRIKLSENIVSSLYEDEEKKLWIGTWGGGLDRITFNNHNTNSTIKDIAFFKHHEKDNKSISSNIVQAIFKDSKNNFWIGTEEGLELFFPKSGKFFHFKSDLNNPESLSDNRIQSKCIIEDKIGNLWIGTWRGLNRVIIKNKINENSSPQISFERFLHNPSDTNSISDNRILSIYEDRKNKVPNMVILWLGTIGGGLNKLNIEIENDSIKNISYKNYMEQDGLPNNVIYGILSDENGNLWLSTNNGISKFNPYTEKFRNYDILDGLQSNQFFWGAFCKARDGELFFGGVNGFNSFYPNELKDNKHIPPIYITNISFIPSNKKTKIPVEKTALWNGKNIKLPYDTYTLNFEFAALDFTTPQRNQYKYKLKNVDNNWVVASHKNSVQYSNINEGEYEFKVIGSNNDAVWNNVGTSILITIETPFWKTWWFITLSLLFLAILIGYFIYTQVQNMLAVERLRTKLAADLHDSIGSSLTEISILSEVISTRLKNVDTDVKKSLNKISSKSRNLIDKMSDIVWLVNPQRDSLYDLILRLQDTYSELLADTAISFRSENLKSLEKISLSMENRQHLFLIFKEAINNSVTHSGCTEIVLNAKVKNKKLEMVLNDNGKGFDTKKFHKGNGLVNMQKRAKSIGGKLIINSELGKGTTVKYIGNIL